MTNFYSIRSTSHGYLIAKFDADFNVASTYQFHNGVCECPAYQRRNKCKHQAMVNLFVSKDRLDTDWFYNNETKTWSQPIASEASLAQDGPMSAEEALLEAKVVPAGADAKAEPVAREPIRRRV